MRGPNLNPDPDFSQREKPPFRVLSESDLELTEAERLAPPELIDPEPPVEPDLPDDEPLPSAAGFATRTILWRRVQRDPGYVAFQREEVVWREAHPEPSRDARAWEVDRYQREWVDHAKAADLALVKLATTETRDPEHLFDFLESFSRLWPYDGNRRPGSRAERWADKEPYFRGTVTAALATVHSTPKPLILDADELDQLPDPAWLIEDVLPADAGAVLYGRRSTYKSFVLLDWGLSVAAGLPWLGRETRPGAFIYVAAEGWAGLKRRKAAWLAQHGGDLERARFVRGAPLSTDTGVERLIATIRARIGDEPVALVGLDTLNRLLPGIEENSPEAMGRAVGIVDRLRTAFPGATVVWVHHGGWQDKHERGHSSLGDDLDAVLHVTEEIEARTVALACEKQKDAEAFPPLRLTLKLVEDSLVVTEAVTLEGTGPGKPLNATQEAMLAALRSANAVNGLSVEGWSKLVPAITERAFKDNRLKLVKLGRVEYVPESSPQRFRVVEQPKPVAPDVGGPDTDNP